MHRSNRIIFNIPLYNRCSGFTTAAVCTIGANQLKNSFGFVSAANVPQIGQTINGVLYEANWQIYDFFINHWNEHDIKGRRWTNPLAIRVRIYSL